MRSVLMESVRTYLLQTDAEVVLGLPLLNCSGTHGEMRTVIWWQK